MGWSKVKGYSKLAKSSAYRKDWYWIRKRSWFFFLRLMPEESCCQNSLPIYSASFLFFFSWHVSLQAFRWSISNARACVS